MDWCGVVQLIVSLHLQFIKSRHQSTTRRPPPPPSSLPSFIDLISTIMLSGHTNPSKPPLLDDRIAVYWPIDQQFFPGVVSNFAQDNKVVVHYDDGDVETLLLEQEAWKYLSPSKATEQVIHHSTPLRNHHVSGTSVPSAQVQAPITTHSAVSNPQTHATPSRPEKSHSATTVPNTSVHGSRKRAQTSSIQKQAPKRKNTSTVVIPVGPGKNDADTRIPVTGAAIGTSSIVPAAPLVSGSAEKVRPKTSTAEKAKPAHRVPVAVTYTTGQPQLARPITSGVPLSTAPPPSHSLPTLPPPIQPSSSETPNFHDALEPMMTSFNARLTSQATRISTIRDMLLNLSPRLSELDERCKILRADVDSLESEVTSRAEMHKLLNGAFVKQMDELNRSQGVILERLKMDFRHFLEGEMKAVEKHLAEEIRSKSAEVFKELFSGVAESIKNSAVKNAIEDMSIPTCPSNKSKRKDAGPSRS